MKNTTIILFFCICLSLNASSCKLSSTDGDWLPGSTYNIGDIRIANADGTNWRLLVDERIQIHYANYLPNGQKIVFVQEEVHGGPLILSSINPDGSDRKTLATLNYFPRPSLSQFQDLSRTCLLTSDSRYLLYIGYDDETRSSLNIHRVAIDGSQIINLTKVNTSGHKISDMALSNDGGQIIYTEYDTNTSDGSVINDEYRLCRIDIDGGQRQILKTLHGNKILFPQFVPADNNMVVYVSRSSQENTSGLLHRLSVTDTSQDRIIASVGSRCNSTAISVDSKLIYLDTTNISGGYHGEFNIVNLNDGTIQKFNLPTTGIIMPSVDNTAFQIQQGSTFWAGRFDGSISGPFSISLPGSGGDGHERQISSTVQSLYFSPDNQRIIYVVTRTVQYWS